MKGVANGNQQTINQENCGGCDTNRETKILRSVIADRWLITNWVELGEKVKLYTKEI